jgi:YD repeat-containing protein
VRAHFDGATTTTFRYDPNNRLTTITDANSNATTLGYRRALRRARGATDRRPPEEDAGSRPASPARTLPADGTPPSRRYPGIPPGGDVDDLDRPRSTAIAMPA